jgi:hypothetical protein
MLSGCFPGFPQYYFRKRAKMKSSELETGMCHICAISVVDVGVIKNIFPKPSFPRRERKCATIATLSIGNNDFFYRIQAIAETSCPRPKRK